MRSALIELIPEKGFDRITIRDITERADVAYATFFRHYESKEALLEERIELEIRELEEVVSASEGDHLRREGLLVFQHVRGQAALYSSLLNEGATRAMRQRLKQVVIAVIHPHIANHYEQIPEPQIPIEVTANHIAAAAWELVAWWLEAGQPLPPEHMALIYERLVVRSALDAAGVSK